ncbi:unnamed protein product [Toxocara canis]|uniref:Uncharacterized protein n=1 Tax=Toxocara canis TaxID=6265 RepID=A0A183UAI4_TOXCA|nr:unnamed protein product [Toxocara canis]
MFLAGVVKSCKRVRGCAQSARELHATGHCVSLKPLKCMCIPILVRCCYIFVVPCVRNSLCNRFDMIIRFAKYALRSENDLPQAAPVFTTSPLIYSEPALTDYSILDFEPPSQLCTVSDTALPYLDNGRSLVANGEFFFSMQLKDFKTLIDWNDLVIQRGVLLREDRVDEEGKALLASVKQILVNDSGISSLVDDGNLLLAEKRANCGLTPKSSIYLDDSHQSVLTAPGSLSVRNGHKQSFSTREIREQHAEIQKKYRPTRRRHFTDPVDFEGALCIAVNRFFLTHASSHQSSFV